MPPSIPRPFPVAVLAAACLSGALLPGCRAGGQPPQAAPAHELVLLVGQSNMSGRGSGADPLGAAAPEPRLLMWDAAAGRVAPARDPLPHQDLDARPVRIGPAMSFGREYLARGRQERRLVLVPAAYGGTGFSDKDGSWRVTSAVVSPLAREAVARANAAMRALRAAGVPAHFVAILWHQGETDGANRMDAQAYAAELGALAGYLRSHIDGAAPATPFIVGQYVPAQLQTSPALQAIAALNQVLPARLPHSACVGSRGLHGNPAPDAIHFDAASQRAMGQRYAAVLHALQRQAPVPACDW